MEFWIIGSINFILCFCVAGMWRGKGRSYGGGFWLSFFFSPLIGFFIGLCLAPVKRTE